MLADTQSGKDSFLASNIGFLMRAAAKVAMLCLIWLPVSADARFVGQESEPSGWVTSSASDRAEAVMVPRTTAPDSPDGDSRNIELIERALRNYSDDEELIHRIAVSLVQEGNAVAVSPRLLTGIMLVENPWLDPDVESSVGAKGLMQVMPFHAGHWPPCGADLGNVEDNICNGARIFAHYYYASDSDLNVALLRYNGCVTGRNTPTCHEYGDRVMGRMPGRDAAVGVQPQPSLINSDSILAATPAPTSTMWSLLIPLFVAAFLLSGNNFAVAIGMGFSRVWPGIRWKMPAIFGLCAFLAPITGLYIGDLAASTWGTGVGVIPMVVLLLLGAYLIYDGWEHRLRPHARPRSLAKALVSMWVIVVIAMGIGWDNIIRDTELQTAQLPALPGALVFGAVTFLAASTGLVAGDKLRVHTEDVIGNIAGKGRILPGIVFVVIALLKL